LSHLRGKHLFDIFSDERGEKSLKKFDLKENATEIENLIDEHQMNGKARLFDLLIHDLTGPLSIVSTSTTNLLHKVDRYGPLTDQQKPIVERILRNVHKAQTLLQEMIEIFRSEEGLFQKELFFVEKVIKESLIDVLEITAPNIAETLCQAKNQEEFHHCLKAHGIFIEMTGEYCKSPFCHDQKKVQQILRNLVSNAIKYRRERMVVSICGDLDLLISVEDDGRGIPQEGQAIIFDRFVRLKDKIRADVPGLGLGLTGVKTLIEAMRGEIILESREGIGTRFTVRIPPLQ
jgi:signal transduction histidine kinase